MRNFLQLQSACSGKQVKEILDKTVIEVESVAPHTVGILAVHCLIAGNIRFTLLLDDPDGTFFEQFLVSFKWCSLYENLSYVCKHEQDCLVLQCIGTVERRYDEE